MLNFGIYVLHRPIPSRQHCQQLYFTSVNTKLQITSLQLQPLLAWQVHEIFLYFVSHLVIYPTQFMNIQLQTPLNYNVEVTL